MFSLWLLLIYRLAPPLFSFPHLFSIPGFRASPSLLPCPRHFIQNEPPPGHSQWSVGDSLNSPALEMLGLLRSGDPVQCVWGSRLILSSSGLLRSWILFSSLSNGVTGFQNSTSHSQAHVSVAILSQLPAISLIFFHHGCI